MSDWTTRISTGLIATVATLLIWTWAAEKTREETTVTGAVRIVPREGQELFVDPTTPIAVTVQLKGSRHALQRAREILEHGAELGLGLGGIPATPGNPSVQLVGAISKIPELQNSDITVESVRPDSVTVSIGKLVTRSAKIVAELPLAQLAGEPTIEPPEAMVTMPATLAESTAVLRLEAFVDARALEPGKRYRIDAPLRLPESLQSGRSNVKVQPDRAKVTFTLLSKNRTAQVPTVPIQIAGPPGDLRNYDIQIDPGSEFLRNVTLSGPGDAIGQIENGRFRVAAIVHLSADDLAKRNVSRPVSLWLLPPGVTVTRIGTSSELAPTIPIKITERPRAAGATPPDAGAPGRNN